MTWGACAHLAIEVKTVPQLAYTATLASACISSSVRVCLLVAMRKPNNEFLFHLWKHFWPTDMLDLSKSLKQYISLKIKSVEGYMLLLTLVGGLSGTQFAMMPFILRNGMLPIPFWFPYDYTAIPVNEILTVWQYFNIFYIVASYIGYDYLFLCSVTNVEIQFKILQEIIRNIFVKSTYEEKEL